MDNVSFSIIPTTSCDRGCPMCSWDSKPKGVSMSSEMLDELASQILRIPGKKAVFYSGGGEPLLHNYLPIVVKKLLADEECIVNITTSGCKNKEDTGYSVLEQISRIRNPRLSVRFSFPAFSLREASSRLKFTLPLIEDISTVTWMNIVIDWDGSKIAEKTRRKYQRVLRSLGYVCGVDDREIRGQIKKLGFKMSHPAVLNLRERWGEWPLGIKEPVVTMDRGKLGVSAGYLVELEVGEVHSEFGRARRIPILPEDKTIIPKGYCCSLTEFSVLQIRTDGSIYPCEIQIPEGVESLSIGKFGEINLAIALQRAQLAKRQMRARHFRSERDCQHNCFHCLPS